MYSGKNTGQTSQNVINSVTIFASFNQKFPKRKCCTDPSLPKFLIKTAEYNAQNKNKIKELKGINVEIIFNT